MTCSDAKGCEPTPTQTILDRAIQRDIPVWFCLPESFDPVEFLLDPELEKRADDARYFISLILTKLARQDVDDRGLVRLHAEYLRNVMHFRSYSQVVGALVEGGAVDRASGYIVGERSFGYRLGNRYLDDRHVRVAATDEALIARIQLDRQRAEIERSARMQPVHFALERQQRRLCIDDREARNELARLPAASNPFDIQGVLVADIRQGNYRLNVGQYGRVSNNITNLKRELRNALRVDGEPLVNIDLRCAQPAFIAAVVKGEGAEPAETSAEMNEAEEGKEDREESREEEDGGIYDVQVCQQSTTFLTYARLVQEGSLYEYLQVELARRGETMSRKVLKKRFLADIIAKKQVGQNGGEYPSLVEDIFRELFPELYAYIRRFNGDGCNHANLIRELQRQESSFVIGTVAADLTTRHPDLFVLTLHDAIYTSPGGVHLVEQAFERAFESTGLKMSLKASAN